MAKKWAIVIGANQYQRFQPLRYAERDAKATQEFLVRDAGFDQVYCFTDRSPKIALEGGASIATQPTAANLRRFFELRFATPFLKQGDTLWFFFSGYGLQYADADYLMPSDAAPEAAETTAITVDTVADYLNRSGADQIVLFLDACRTEEQKFGQGFGTDPKGVVSVFSTALGETACESEALQLGSFTYTLLEGLRLHGSNPGATMAQLVQYVSDRLPQVNLSGGQPPQSPRLSANAAIPPEAMLLPQAIVPVTDRKSQQKPDGVKTVSKRPADYVAQAIALVSQHPILQAGTASLATLAIGLIGLTAYRALEPYFNANAPERWATLWSASWANPTPSPEPSSAIFSLKDNFYQRLPRPGTYNATTSLFSQSYREVSSGNGRFCIKVVNAAAAKAPATAAKAPATAAPAAKVPTAKASAANLPNVPQVTVSTLSFRDNGVYIDATRERLQIDGTFTEMTDSKSTWQWSKAEVDRSDLVAECLASTTTYVREMQGAVKN